jgi:hypothetical protein
MQAAIFSPEIQQRIAARLKHRLEHAANKDWTCNGFAPVT